MDKRFVKPLVAIAILLLSSFYLGPKIRYIIVAQQLLIAVQKGDKAKVDFLLVHGAWANMSLAKSTPLAVSIVHDNVPLAEDLISHGANVNTIDAVGRTPLMKAVECGNPTMVALLLKHKADPKFSNRHGDSLALALKMYAKSANKQEYLKIISDLRLAKMKRSTP